MAKHKQKEHEKIRAEIEQAKKDKQRNVLYSLRTGCDDTINKGGTKVKAMENFCKYVKHGCDGTKKHKTNRSKQCNFFGMTDVEIIGECFFYL